MYLCKSSHTATPRSVSCHDILSYRQVLYESKTDQRQQTTSHPPTHMPTMTSLGFGKSSGHCAYVGNNVVASKWPADLAVMTHRLTICKCAARLSGMNVQRNTIDGNAPCSVARHISLVVAIEATVELSLVIEYACGRLRGFNLSSQKQNQNCPDTCRRWSGATNNVRMSTLPAVGVARVHIHRRPTAGSGRIRMR